MASPISSPAPPLHVQHLEKALRLEPFFGFVEGIFSDQFVGSLSDSDNSGLSDLEHDIRPKGKDGLVNGVNSEISTNGFMQPDELKIDKTRLYNFTKVKKERRWLMDVLLSDSSESSDDDGQLGEEDLQQMLWLHKQQKKAQERYYQDGDLSRYQHYSTGLLYSQDRYHDLQKQAASSKKVKKKMKDGKIKLKVKKEKVKVKKRKKSDDQIDDQTRLTLEERVYKKILIRRKEADAKRKKIWSIICRKEIPRAQRQKASARNNMLSNAKKLAQLCQKERRREAQRSQRITQQTAPRARRLSREMMAYWKKYEKVEKEHRKRAEKEAMEQRKMDDELREARRQQRKLNFLITQTELYAHFMSKKLKHNKKADSEVVQSILNKLDEQSDSHRVKTVQGGVVYDMDVDKYDAKAMKLEALANAEIAMKEQEARTHAFDASIPAQEHGNKKVALSQESFDENFSLANPNLTIDHPQPELFQGILKTYQLKGMNWLITLYEQGINGILADEMGLGKTVQSIAFLSYLAEVHHIWGPFLVVAPASTLHNWQQEVARFIPNFKVLPYWGNQSDRKSLRKFWSQKQGHISDKDHAPFHLLITSYQLVVQDVRYFQRIKWQYIVLDEAQAIKSSSSVRWKILLGYQCRNRLLLTGTPIQNSMAELWALLHFIMPTLFDSHEEFNEWFSKDIESHAENKSIIDQNQLSRLHMILKPFMLRRIKRDVENELSEKIEIKLVCGLTTRQKWLYQAVKNKISIDDLVYTSASSSSASNATTSSLMNLVMQFRKVCNHPELFERRDVYSPLSSVQVSSYLIPKLIYREGNAHRMFPGCSKILFNTMNIWTSNYIASSLHSRLAITGEQVPESSCFSFLRFINVTAEEAAAFMQKSLTYRLLLLLILLKEVRHLHHRQFWSLAKPASRCLDRHSLLIWPSMTTSFPNIQTSPVLSSLVFTGYNKPILGHVTHSIQPILDEKELPPKKAGTSKAHPTSPLKHSSTGPFSPTGHHHHHHHHKHHKHHRHHHHHKSQAVVSPNDESKSSVYVYPEVGHVGLPMTYPQQRELQLTHVPSLLMSYIPKIVASNHLSYCSDRSAAYEIQDLVSGGSTLNRNLLLYGDPAGCNLKERKTLLFPPSLGGLEGSRPPKGWSFVQMPRRSALITDSGKLTVLDGLLTKLKMQDHRVLIYSQMTRMIDILEEFMTYRKHKYMRLDGSSKISDRRDMVADFQNKKDIFVFLLSTRAGGLGINLTAADTVVFYDSDWNPTVDQQAMDRAHRLGQTRQVTVYRLVTKNTIEERILQRAKEKSEIQKMVISGGHFKPDALKPKEVVSLLLDDEELESKFLQRQAEKKADEQRKRRERKRKKGLPAEIDSPLLPENQSTPPPKAKKGRKSKTSLFPPAPEHAVSLSEVSSINGLAATDVDNISVMSLDEVSLVSGDGSTLSDINQSNVATPSSIRPENDDSMTFEDPPSETASPSSESSSKRGKTRGRGRSRTRGSSMRGRGTGPIRVGRGRGRGRGSSGALAASAAASAAAAAASAAAYAAYGFTFQGTPTMTPTPPPSRSSPVSFGGGVASSSNTISHPVPRYETDNASNSNTNDQS